MATPAANKSSQHANAASAPSGRVVFQTLRSAESAYAPNNFVHVALKRAFDESRPDDDGVLFVSVSRGYTTASGQRRFKMHLTVPQDAALLEWLSAAIREMA